MAKNKKRAVPADLWIQRATAAQLEKMKTALGLSDHITRTVRELEEEGPPIVRMTASEALYGFAGWLTSREPVTIMSAREHAGPIADLVARFMKANELPDCREGWDKTLIHPEVTPSDNVGAPRPPTVPLHPVPVLDNALPDGQRLVAWGVDDLGFDTAYVCEKVKPSVDGGVPSYRLLKLRIERGVVVHIEAGVENLREILLQDIEDHILRDA